MALTHLVDCSNMAIGAVPIARPETAEFALEANEIESESDAFAGAYEIDVGNYSLRATLTAQDPLIVPTIAALTAAQTIVAEGRVANSATYAQQSLLTSVLTGINLDLVDNQPGRATFDFQNRAAAATTTIANVYTGAAGTAPALVERRGVYRIVGASCTFTPDEGEAVTLYGLSRVNWRAQAIASIESSPGALLTDLVTVLGWRITGSVSFSDKTLVTTQTLAARLTAMARGTLVVVLRATGFAGESPAPANQIITLDRVKFGRVAERFQSKRSGAGDLGFQAILKSALGVALALEDMVAVSEEA